MSIEFEIRPACAAEVARLGDLELEADRRFAQIAELADLPSDLTPVVELQQAQRADLLWIAATSAGELAGFAYAAEIDEYLHLEQLSVLPRFGRQGLGTALVDRVCARAAAMEKAGVSLSTFRDVAWNAPYYARLGFVSVELDRLTPGLRQAFEVEAERGLPIDRRVVMIRAN